MNGSIAKKLANRAGWLAVSAASAAATLLWVHAGVARASSAAAAAESPHSAKSDGPMTPAAGRALMDKYCMDCHNASDYAGGLEFEAYDPGDAHSEAQTTEKMLRKLRAGMMPPAGKPRPDAATIQAFAASLESEVDAHAKPDLNEPKLHRLNRTEYQNAVRDLFNLEIDSSQFLPTDDASRGFDNQAGTLTVSPALLDAYLSAASKISRIAIGDAITPSQTTYRVPEDTTQNYHVDGLPFGTRGGLEINHTFPADGKYTLKTFSVNLGNMGNFRPFGEIRGEQLLVYLDDKRIAKVDWDKALGVGKRFDEDDSGQLKTIDVTVPVTAGLHKIAVTFQETNLAPGLDMNHAFDRSTIETGGLPGFTFYPHIGRVRIDGPVDGKPATVSGSREQIFSCYPKRPAEEESCARTIVTTLARRAYRGYATLKDTEGLMKFYAQARQNKNFDSGIEAVLQRILADPKFLFRVEATPPGQTPGQPYTISDLDLASRLSFFLWSSIPDDTLLKVASSGQLSEPEVLKQQIERMLSDPRAEAVTTNFAGQWLALRSLNAFDPVVDQFPDFDDNLRQALRREVELLFQSVLVENRSVIDLLTADYTFLNERLAAHYGIAGIKGSYFRRVQLDPSHSDRWGLIGKGAILSAVSYPNRTSPTKRGNWILRYIIGVAAPDPPADVPQLKAKPPDAAGNSKPPSMREQMTEHRADPHCAGCHKMMDPIGFALEPFDAVGGFRLKDGDALIDTRSTMYDGSAVDGPAGVRAFLLRHQDQYLRNVMTNLMTYALGRGMEYDDMPTMRALLKTASKDNYRLRGMIETVAMSDLFRMNVAAGDEPGKTTAPVKSAMTTAKPAATPAGGG